MPQGHVAQRAKERSKVSIKEINALRAALRKLRLKKGRTYYYTWPNRGHAIIGDVGKGRPKHVVKTIYRPSDSPPGSRLTPQSLGLGKMPFKSKAQMRYLFATNPKLAKKFAKKTPKNSDLPERVKTASLSRPQRAAFYLELIKLSQAGIKCPKCGHINKPGSSKCSNCGYVFEKSKQAAACPLATRDLKLNTKNRNKAIQADHIQYGPLNLDDEAYWERLAEHWKTTPDVAKQSKCSNCVAFDISPRMQDCMPGMVQEDGYLGYCHMHDFKCHSARTCYTWAKGGPITKDSVSLDWDKQGK